MLMIDGKIRTRNQTENFRGNRIETSTVTVDRPDVNGAVYTLTGTVKGGRTFEFTGTADALAEYITITN